MRLVNWGKPGRAGDTMAFNIRGAAGRCQRCGSLNPMISKSPRSKPMKPVRLQAAAALAAALFAGALLMNFEGLTGQ